MEGKWFRKLRRPSGGGGQSSTAAGGGDGAQETAQQREEVAPVVQARGKSKQTSGKSVRTSWNKFRFKVRALAWLEWYSKKGFVPLNITAMGECFLQAFGSSLRFYITKSSSTPHMI